LYVAARSKRPKPAATLEDSIKCISDYFSRKNTEPPESDESVFSKFLASELVKIQDDDIKRSVKRKLTEVIFDAVEEDAQKQKQQQQHVQYMLLGDGSLHPLVHIPES